MQGRIYADRHLACDFKKVADEVGYLAARLKGRADMTSPRPPTLDHGAASVATKTSCNMKQLQWYLA